MVIYNFLDNLGQYWELKGGNSPYQLSSVGQYSSVHKSLGSRANKVVITLKDPTSNIPNNGAGFKIAAHIAWESGSAFFAGPCTICIPENPSDDATNILEFPSIALQLQQ